MLNIYKNTPVFTSYHITKYYIETLNLKNYDLSRFPSDLSGNFYFICINEEGNIDAILQTTDNRYMYDKKFNDLVVDILFSGEYNSMKNVTGRNSKYRLLICIGISNGKLFQSGHLSYPYSNYEGFPRPIKGIIDLENKIEYPEDAYKNKIEGEVVVRFIVDVDGHIKNLEILYDPGYGLSEAAIRAIKSVEWEPGTRNGIYIISSVTLPIQFRLSKIEIDDK